MMMRHTERTRSESDEAAPDRPGLLLVISVFIDQPILPEPVTGYMYVLYLVYKADKTHTHTVLQSVPAQYIIYTRHKNSLQ